MSKQNNYELVAKGIKVSGVFGRLFGYMIFYIPIVVALILLINLSGKDFVEFFGIPDTDFALSLLVFGATSLPFILWEMSIRSWRKKHGLSVWKNIEEDLKQMAVDKQIAREQKALKKYEEK